MNTRDIRIFGLWVKVPENVWNILYWNDLTLSLKNPNRRLDMNSLELFRSSHHQIFYKSIKYDNSMIYTVRVLVKSSEQFEAANICNFCKASNHKYHHALQDTLYVLKHN